MKKYLIKLLIWLFILFVVIGFDYLYDKKSQEETQLIEVLIVEKYIAYGAMLDMNHVKKVKIPVELYDTSMVTELKRSYAAHELYPKSFITKEVLLNEQPILLKDTQRLITIKCSIVEANGWNFSNDDEIDLVIVPANKPEIVLNDLIVYKMFGNSDQNEYVTLIADVNQAYTYYNHVNDSHIYMSMKKIN